MKLIALVAILASTALAGPLRAHNNVTRRAHSNAAVAACLRNPSCNSDLGEVDWPEPRAIAPRAIDPRDPQRAPDHPQAPFDSSEMWDTSRCLPIEKACPGRNFYEAKYGTCCSLLNNWNCVSDGTCSSGWRVIEKVRCCRGPSIPFPPDPDPWQPDEYEEPRLARRSVPWNETKDVEGSELTRERQESGELLVSRAVDGKGDVDVGVPGMSREDNEATANGTPSFKHKHSSSEAAKPSAVNTTAKATINITTLLSSAPQVAQIPDGQIKELYCYPSRECKSRSQNAFTKECCGLPWTPYCHADSLCSSGHRHSLYKTCCDARSRSGHWEWPAMKGKCVGQGCKRDVEVKETVDMEVRGEPVTCFADVECNTGSRNLGPDGCCAPIQPECVEDRCKRDEMEGELAICVKDTRCKSRLRHENSDVCCARKCVGDECKSDVEKEEGVEGEDLAICVSDPRCKSGMRHEASDVCCLPMEMVWVMDESWLYAQNGAKAE